MSDDGKLRIVLLLGAGASTCFSCPTINGFCDRLNQMELALHEASGVDKDKVLGYIKDYWALRHKCMLAASIGRCFDPDNYEDILSVANEWKDWGWKDKRDIKKWYESAKNAIASVLYNPVDLSSHFGGVFNRSRQDAEAAGSLGRGFPVLAKDNYGQFSIITFNVDFMLERQLLENDCCINYHFVAFKKDQQGNIITTNSDRDIKGSMRLLKLHGSLNWLRTKVGGPFKLMLSEDVEGISFVDKVISWPTIYKPFIVEPTLRKVVRAKKMKEIWNEAYKAVSTAHYLIVCGYSFPNTDLHAVSFLRSAISENPSLRRIYLFDKDCITLYKRLINHFEESFVNRVFRAFVDDKPDRPTQHPAVGVEALAYFIERNVEANRPDHSLRKLVAVIDSKSNNRSFLSQ